ncbi:hypothetical protein Slala05_81960 [Streptomyces lavendulae subsp. lavendulae]|nr:hypothetical protein Slala05_81960 [Streptomyces lavendulae subsp. lavendulae]
MEIMEILEAYDLTGSYRAAAEPASCEGPPLRFGLVVFRFASPEWPGFARPAADGRHAHPRGRVVLHSLATPRAFPVEVVRRIVGDVGRLGALLQPDVLDAVTPLLLLLLLLLQMCQMRGVELSVRQIPLVLLLGADRPGGESAT